MFDTIIIVFKGTARVVRRINVDALDLAGEFLFKRFECQQVVAEDEPIIEEIVIGDTMRRVARLLRVFEQDAWLQPRPVLLADPGQFQSFFMITVGHVARALLSVWIG